MNWFKNNYWLLAILVLAAILRFYHADFQSLWVDEVLTMENANPKLTFSQFNDRIMFWEFIPHLYFFLVRTVFQIFGESIIAARLFTGLIGVVGVWAIYLLAKELFGRKVGLFASLLLAVNAFHISHSQDIRPYAMLTLFTVLAFYRLVVFVRKPTLLNAVYHGIFAALIVHSHFFGFITIFAQYVILLVFILVYRSEMRTSLFKLSFVSGIVTAILLIPALQTIQRVSEVKAFWLQKPGPEAFTTMFRDFFANSEMVLFCVYILALFFLFQVFRQKMDRISAESIFSNKLIVGFLVLFIWISVSIVIPTIKSYLDVSMILSRYFINILPVILLAVAVGIDEIRNLVVQRIVIVSILVLSLVDLTVVRNYYNTPTKSQLRELTKEIVRRDTEKSKVVSFWGWIFPYFFRNTGIEFKQSNLQDYVKGLRSGSIAPESFWYAETNGRTFDLSAEDQAYLEQNFYMKENLQYLDAWAHYYVSKTITSANAGASTTLKPNGNLDLNAFKPVQFDTDGSILLFENTNARSGLFRLDQGRYELVFKGTSFPATPIKGENAHLKIRINGKEVANFYLSEKPDAPAQSFPFDYAQKEPARIQIIYDNDLAENGKDRNAIIKSISILKK